MEPNRSSNIRAIQDFIVTGCGLVTSCATGLTLALLETTTGLAIYSFMCWLIIPIGAIGAGLVSASGYYFGARFFHHRPTRLLIFNVMSVSVSTYFVINYLNYSMLEINGKHVADVVPFGTYLNAVWTTTSMDFRVRGVKVGESAEMGSLGYVYAVLQMVGFAAGGLCVYWYLRSIPFCERCSKYFKTTSKHEQYSENRQGMADTYSAILGLLAQGQGEGASELVARLNQNRKKKVYRLLLKFWQCEGCSRKMFEIIVQHRDGRNYVDIPKLHIRENLPISSDVSLSMPAGT